MNVKQDPAGLEEMLKASNGGRSVPVIVEGEQVTIGWDGGT